LIQPSLRPVTRSPGLFKAVLLFLATVAAMQAQVTPVDLGDAAEFAKRAAKAALAGSPRIFAEALDIDGMLEKGLGAEAWKSLTARQQDQLRAIVREQLLYMLGSRSPGSEISWSWHEGADGGADVLLGLKLGDKNLKTRWVVRHVGSGWKITDIILSDPGISLAQTAIQALGPQPVRRRQRVREAEEVAYPRLVGLAAIALFLVVVAPRVAASKRILIFLTAAAPAILLAVDGSLAVHRTLAERFALREGGSRAPWREDEELALEAEKDGQAAEAGRHWAKALANGAPPAPIEFQMGLAARRRGDLERARLDFVKALEEREPAPGAARELASLDTAAGRYAEADRNLERYLALSGPDPESLSLAAVLQANLGKASESLRTLERARALVGNSWRAEELEAQVRARARDAAGAVAALRLLDAEGRVDRAALRADPNYLPIATDPAWVAFINERTAPTSIPAKPARR
jgi:tetratricopeptide (TPR) repeat protein/ABC-type transporter MlaC component